MTLSTRLAREFSANTQRNGSNYYRQGRVSILTGNANQVHAKVRGTMNYLVKLDYGEDCLAISCSCPAFDQYVECKHAWATVLAAEAKGYLAFAASNPRLEVDYPDVNDIEGFDDDELGDVIEFAPASRPNVPKRPPAWKTELDGLAASNGQTSATFTFSEKRQVVYIVDTRSNTNISDLVISLASRSQKMDGSWGKSVALAIKPQDVAGFPVQEDRDLLGMLAGSVTSNTYGYYYVPSHSSYQAIHPLASTIMRLATSTGRCYLRTGSEDGDLRLLEWDHGGAWHFNVELKRESKKTWKLAGFLKRGDERMDLAVPEVITKGGLVFTKGKVAPLTEDAPFQWLIRLRRSSIEVPDGDQNDVLATLLSIPGVPSPEVPEELQYQELQVDPKPHLRIREPQTPSYGSKLEAQLEFEYEERLIPSYEAAGGFYDAQARRFVRRNSTLEREAVDLLTELGLKYGKFSYREQKPVWELPPKKLPGAVRTLVEKGWHIEADGKTFRRPGAFQIDVSSKVDWFELHGSVEYGETTAKLPALLAAAKKGDKMVQLDDGTYGVLPEEWLGRLGLLAGLGIPENGHIRFRPSQAGLLDALLATQPEARCDETFTRVRHELRSFQGVEAAKQPDGFDGQLRGYQCEGLGWMDFLRRFSFGGCLADEMGVGKTAQVLALLETRRAARTAGENVGPSLVVVPRSLVFNWKEESARFTPHLRVLDYTGSDRNGQDLNQYDIVLTTYGTLRRDAVRMKDVDFDYVVLDEAQAIKNANTESAKAVRLLQGSHRLALSGTPVENHLGELWSLFEFLNPGMLGAASVFKLAGGRNPDEETRQLLAHALRPFILRRTKEQVARELPAKTEQTIHCELEPEQRKLYNELRQHYRDSLLHRIQREGLAKSKIQVLEALLRLRQVACHPGLLDPKRRSHSSAKLDVLVEQLSEVVESGHKALVFSQFTTLLGILRERLDNDGVVYEYLDGSTRDRKTCVERFQNDDKCPLFLISLKAGGLGLNLTAAEYVFLLDPWWNPAVEAQAVDRAHRIGQTKQVFAYRLIARDTVEEKVLELQKSKRDLAAAIISEDNSVIANLKREDLELLLS
jgi:hypothetical protein